MPDKYSASLTRFRELIKNDNKRNNSKKNKEEKRDLLDWYVDNCPANDGPEKANKFADFGIKYNNDFKKLKNRIINAVGLEKEVTYKYCESGSKMESLIDEIEKIYSSNPKPIIFFSKGRYYELDSLYIRIRNSFAHGNYFKARDYYYLWNETGSEGKTKRLGSFLVLKYSDLKVIFNALSAGTEK